MSIEVACRCGHSFRVKDKYAGREGKCPQCGKMVQVPALGAEEATPGVVGPAFEGTSPSHDDLIAASARVQREEQARIALEIQHALLPRHPPELSACELAGVLQPAPLSGGDYYDFFPLQDGSLAIAIADPSGHGVRAAVLVAQARACVRSLAQAYSDPGTIFTLANRVFAAAMPDDIYATLTLARFDLNTRLLSYASAGHPTGYVFDARGNVKWNLESTDCPLGLLNTTIYGTSSPLLLEPGELVLLVTGGVLKSRDVSGNAFGPERIVKLVEAHHTKPAPAIAAALCQAARNFAGSPTDDLTAVAMRVR